MARALLQEDVIIDYDSQGHIIVDRYAKALEILDGDNTKCWQYEEHEFDGVRVHYAKLLGDLELEVKGAQAELELSSMVTYNVYVDLKLEDDEVGFDHPVMFEFEDLHMATDQFPYQLQPGDNMVHVGRFLASPGSIPKVSMRMYDFATHKKKGLLVRRMRITTA